MIHQRPPGHDQLLAVAYRLVFIARTGGLVRLQVAPSVRSRP
ncbi:MAG: hypothetical protein ACR2MN_00140 [Acidimicrobiales bacterium]